MKKICPICKEKYSEIENYCMECGVELIDEPNRCSEMKRPLCKEQIYPDKAKYCTICGAPTIYAKPLIEELKNW